KGRDSDDRAGDSARGIEGRRIDVGRRWPPSQRRSRYGQRSVLESSKRLKSARRVEDGCRTKPPGRGYRFDQRHAYQRRAHPLRRSAANRRWRCRGSVSQNQSMTSLALFFLQTPTPQVAPTPEKLPAWLTLIYLIGIGVVG